jgi:DNA-directed RNA polymerase subunit RPC12/RpoP
MNQCPACGKHFIRPSTLQRGAKDICPYCKADFLQAVDEKIKRELGNK